MVTVLSFLQHKLVKIIFGLYIVIYLFIWSLSSPVTKYYIKPMLAEQNLILSDASSIRFNPFLMRITVDDLTLYQLKDKTRKKVAAIDKLIAQISLWQLIFDELSVSQFEFTGGYLRLTHNQDELTLAGVALPNNKKEEVTAENEQLVSVSPYQLLLPELLINQFTVDIENNDKTHQLVIEELQLNTVKASQAQQAGQLTLNALLDKSSVNISLDANLVAGQGDINSKINLSDYPLNHLAPYAEQLTMLDGIISFNSEQKLSISSEGLNLHIKEAEINNQKLVVGLAEQRVTLTAFKQKLSDLELKLTAGEMTQLKGSSSMHFNDAKVIANQNDEQILSFEQLALDSISFHLENEPKIQITELVLNKLNFSQKQLSKPIQIAEDLFDTLPPIAQLEQLTISDIGITEKSIAINNIIIDGISADIIVDADKNIINLVSLDNQTNTEQRPNIKDSSAVNPQKVSNDKQEENEAIIYSLKNVKLINNNEITLADYSVEPAYKRSIFIDTLTLGTLSNAEADQEQQTPFAFIGRSNKYANFNLTGFIQPFSAIKNYHIEGDLKEFSLPAISSYMKESTGIEVKTGQLNTGLNITLTDDNLAGNIVVLLQGLETDLVDIDEADSLIHQGALPLNMAMGMLKDSNGNVELDVPVSGSTSDPSFGLHSIISLITQKAIISATQDYLMTTFVPYANIVSVAVTAGQLALKLRFDDLPYQIKQVEPNEQQQEYLKQFIALMQDKEDTRVTLCAVSTPADIDLTSTEKTINKKDIQRLKTLGKQREDALKAYLVEQGKISSSRILVCKPQIDSSENALPRISISV